MKKYFFHIGMLAIASIAFLGCQREVDNANKGEAKHYATVSIGKPGETRTAVVEGATSATYKWTEGDERYFHVYENDVEGAIEGISYSEDMSVATLTVSFTGSATAPSSYVYTAKYFKEKSNNGNPLVLAEQKPVHSEEGEAVYDNFDPAADLMISKEIESVDGPLTSIQFTMGRVVTINKMTLTGLVEGEKVQKVELSLDKQLVAVFVGPENYSGQGYKLTLNYMDNPVTVTQSGQVPVYFVCAPVTGAGIKSVVVTTDKNVYVKSDQLDPNPFSGKTISFAIGTMKRFTMAMDGYGQSVGETVKYIEVTSADQIVNEGIYLITSTKTNGDVVAMGAYNSSSYFEACDVNLTKPASGDKFILISSEQITPVTLVEIGDGQFNIVGPGDKYLSYSSGNTVTYGDFDNTNSDAFSWTVAANEIVNVDVPARKLQYNSGSPRFACYTSNQRSIALYYKEGSVAIIPDLPAPTNVEAEVDGNSIVVTWNDIVAPAGQEVTYSVTCTGQDNQIVEQGEEGCIFENLEDGIYTVSVTALSSDSEYNDSPTVIISDLEVDQVPDPASYVKVTSSLSDWSGQYLIVFEENSVAFDGSLTNLDATPNTFEVIIQDDKILSSTEVDAKSFTIAVMEEGYSIQASSGKFIGRNANSNGIDSRDDAQLNTISWSGHPVITAVGSKTLGFNNADGQKKFRYLGNSNINLYKLEDNRQDPGMSWSASSATASWNTGNTVSGFAAPTLTEGKATGITYESTNPAVATITNAGVVTIVGPGVTSIKAIFAGDATYKAKTVSYTLTVTDNRDAVATPVILPEATGTVATGTEVTITCTTEGATIHYTDNGSVPTAESATYTGAITLTESKTIKAIAIKDGYKDSAVATATYTVGVVNTSTKDNPYSAAEVIEIAGQLPANGTLADVYVSGIISEITTAYNSQYGNVSFNISADGLTSSTQFMIFRAAATSADDFKVGDAVEFMGTLNNYKGANQTTTTPQLQAGATLIYQIHAPSFSPNGGSFTDSQVVTISADQDATIRYTLDGSTPTVSSGSVYTGVLSLTETTNVKAIAIKNGVVTGVVSASFTKSNGGGSYSLTPDQTSTGSSATTYITTLTAFTYNGISWKMNQWNPSSLQVKTNQANASAQFRFYNTSAFSGRIAKVVITFSAMSVIDASKLMFLGGTSEVSATSGGTAGTWDSTTQTLTWTPAANENYTYFAFYQDGKAASGTNKLAETDAIVVTYE